MIPARPRQQRGSPCEKHSARHWGARCWADRTLKERPTQREIPRTKGGADPDPCPLHPAPPARKKLRHVALARPATGSVGGVANCQKSRMPTSPHPCANESKPILSLHVLKKNQALLGGKLDNRPGIYASKKSEPSFDIWDSKIPCKINKKQPTGPHFW